ncbi:MAG: YncE family protein [Chitinophagaceae bacterium]|nr:YncE family protein [Chitinophagaceae bacterium]
MKKLFLLMALTVTLASQSYSQKEFSVIKTFHIASTGGWDYLAAGPGNNRLYVSHGNQVNILNATTGDSIGVIENTTGVHGIAFDKEHGKGFTSNGRTNNVTVFDLITNKVITQIPAGQNPDAIMYEPISKTIITCNGRSKNLTVIDPVKYKVIDSIAVSGKPETAVSNDMGKIYVNIEDKSEIQEIDMKTLKVVNTWSIKPAEEPTGLVIDKKANRLFAGCGNKLLAVVDASSGKLIQTLPIGDGCDGVGFDPATKNIFASNGEGTLSIYHAAAPDKYKPVATVVTKRGARTVTVDPLTHLVYLPTADFEAPDPNQPKQRPKMIPGTFQVLVVGQ